VFCLLVVLVWLSIPVPVIDWKRLVSEMTYNALMGTLNPTHSLSHCGSVKVLYVYEIDSVRIVHILAHQFLLGLVLYKNVVLFRFVALDLVLFPSLINHVCFAILFSRLY